MQPQDLRRRPTERDRAAREAAPPMATPTRIRQARRRCARSESVPESEEKVEGLRRRRHRLRRVDADAGEVESESQVRAEGRERRYRAARVNQVAVGGAGLPSATGVGEEHPHDVAASAVKATRPILPVAREVETQITTVFDLCERNAVALRRAARSRRTTVARSDVVSGARAAEVEARKRSRPVDGEASLERQRIAVEPTTENNAHVELGVRSET